MPTQDRRAGVVALVAPVDSLIRGAAVLVAALLATEAVALVLDMLAAAGWAR